MVLWRLHCMVLEVTLRRPTNKVEVSKSWQSRVNARNVLLPECSTSVTLLPQTPSTPFLGTGEITVPLVTPVSSRTRPLTLGTRYHVALTAAAIAEWRPPVHSDFLICPRNSG
jgi:hypothetical protein